MSAARSFCEVLNTLVGASPLLPPTVPKTQSSLLKLANRVDASIFFCLEQLLQLRI